MDHELKNLRIFLENIKAEKQRIAVETKDNPEPPKFIPIYKRVYNKAKRFVRKHVMKANTTPTNIQYTQLRNPHSKLKRLLKYQEELVFNQKMPKVYKQDKHMHRLLSKPVDSTGSSHHRQTSKVANPLEEKLQQQTLRRPTAEPIPILDFEKAAQYIIGFMLLNIYIEYPRKMELRQIGEGTYGVIYKFGNKYVIKIPKREYIKELNREIDIFKQLNKKVEHTNIIKATYWGECNNIPFLVLPYLEDYVNLYTVVSMDINYRFIYNQILSALGHLHKAGFAHFDLNPTNIMYNKNTTHICIIDFGLSCMNTCDGFYNPSLFDNPMVPPYYGLGSISLDQGKCVDYYFLGVITVLMLSKGTITPRNVTRHKYTQQVAVFKASLTDRLWAHVSWNSF